MPDTTYDLAQLALLSGEHVITCKANASGYSESPFSNSVTYAKIEGAILDKFMFPKLSNYNTVSFLEATHEAYLISFDLEHMHCRDVAGIEYTEGWFIPNQYSDPSYSFYCDFGYVFDANPTASGGIGTCTCSEPGLVSLSGITGDGTLTYHAVAATTKTITLTADSYQYRIYDGLNPADRIQLTTLAPNDTRTYTITSGFILIELDQPGEGWYGISVSGTTAILVYSPFPADSFSAALQLTVSGESASVSYDPSCFLPDTLITLADGSKKQIKDIEYTDKLKVWNFDEGKYDVANICWLTKSGCRNDHYYKLTLSDGTVLKTTGKNSNHKVYNVDERYFKGVAYSEVGDKVFTEGGIATIVSKEYVSEIVEYYNLITSKQFNCFADGVLTSDRYGNMYPIDENMVFVKEPRPVRPLSEFTAVGISEYWYENFRLYESADSLDSIKKYVKKCERQMRALPEGYDPLQD